MTRPALTASVLLAHAVVAQGTWIPADGGCPWHDREGRYVIGKLPVAYVGHEPVPQQACDEPRRLLLPADGAAQVFIAISSTQSAEFAERLKLESTGDQLSLMDAAGKRALMTYDILIYRDPPRLTPFPGAKAGIMLLSWPGLGGREDAGARQAPAGRAAGKNVYTPDERAWPWHDRVDQWLMVDVPPGVKHGDPVPQQSCTARSIVLPADDVAAVTIGISDGDVPLIPANLTARVADTGSDFHIQAPSGGRKLPYSVFVFRNPPRQAAFTGFKAGVVLLALKEMDVMSEPRTATPERKPAVSGILQPEQEFAAQEWPFEPGERRVKMHVAEPKAGINANTGMMLCLHNWGGIYNQPAYIQWCTAFADRYNVVAASVNYLQSGDGEPKIVGEKPYDHGYLQAMDCIRALYHISRQLTEAGAAFNPRRCYSMGGSGGGNVSLMVNKLAPHTFACVVDICGMPGLTDGIAYGTGEYGSGLNAGYAREPDSPARLTTDMQEIRDPGHPGHLKRHFQANPTNKVVIVHGLDDRSCPAPHKITIFRNMVAAGFHPDGHFLTPKDVDGQVITTTGHAVGNRQRVVETFADVYLLEAGSHALQLPGPNDFERGKQVAFPTTNGQVIVDYSAGPPSVRFEAATR